MRLCIQDPSWPQSEYLLERMIEACEEATCGAAAFAFASTGGIRLLLEDETFSQFLTRSSFEMVVGVDAVTNVSALQCLKTYTQKYRRLQVRVFLNDVRDSLFHPKFCWFSNRDRTFSLIGSGNLTPGGLRGNREAFTLTQTSNQNASQLRESWTSWLGFHEQRLFSPDHPKVLARARLNLGTEFPPNWTNDMLLEDENGSISVGLPKNASDAVLIAEIPKSGDRWNQANFNLETFQNYFGATPGETQRVILTHISSTGEIGIEEIRPSVAVSSHNFRFELEAASGLRYPQTGRPLAIFVRVATRTFRYRLLMPGTNFHDSAFIYLNDNCDAPARGLRRLVTTVGALQQELFFSGLATDKKA